MSNPRSPSSVPTVIETEYVKESHTQLICDAFVHAVERLERLIEKETAVLSENQPISLDGFNHQKRHGLLELSRAMDALRGLDVDCLGNYPKASLARLREKLQKNLAILQTHLDAVGAISAIIVRAIQEHDSDGTYTAQIANKGWSP